MSALLLVTASWLCDASSALCSCVLVRASSSLPPPHILYITWVTNLWIYCLRLWVLTRWRWSSSLLFLLRCHPLTSFAPPAPLQGSQGRRSWCVNLASWERMKAATKADVIYRTDWNSSPNHFKHTLNVRGLKDWWKYFCQKYIFFCSEIFWTNLGLVLFLSIWYIERLCIFVNFKHLYSLFFICLQDWSGTFIHWLGLRRLRFRNHIYWSVFPFVLHFFFTFCLLIYVI